MTSTEFDAPVWTLWRQVKRHFPTWSLLPSAFWTRGAWTFIGIDVVSGFRRNASTRAVFALLADRSDGELDRLIALAMLNSRRQRQMFTAVAVAYVTIPLTAMATWADIAPDAIKSFLREEFSIAVQLFATATLAALVYFCSLWRSRQVVEVLELVRIERGGRQFTAEPGDET